MSSSSSASLSEQARAATTQAEAAEAAAAPEIGDITSTPAHGKIIRHEDKEYQTVQEGRAFILIPKSEDNKKDGAPQAVFYNPIQQFNRDLTTLAIRAFGEHAIGEKKAKFERGRSRDAQQQQQQQSKRGTKRKREVQEGKADVDDAKEEKDSGANDDMDIDDGAGERPYVPRFSILDALSATGLRALRFAKEIPFASSVVGNDLSSSAIASMRLNIRHNSNGNGVDTLVQPHQGDACAYMYSVAAGTDKTGRDRCPHGRFDVVDLDPYGTAAPFMDAAVQAVKHGGLLCVTCTDAGVFASNGYPEKAFALYGGTTVKGLHSHEGGLRLILYALATSAARYGLAVEPMLSLSIDYYVRVFVRVYQSPSDVKFLASSSMVVYSCDSGCGAWKTQPLAALKQKKNKAGTPFYHHAYAQGTHTMPVCEHCGFKTHVGGPMWAGPLHNPVFIQRILDLLPGADTDVYRTTARIEGMLVTALEEDLSIDQPRGGDGEKGESPSSPSSSLAIPRLDPRKIEPHPFFFIPSMLCKVVHAQTIHENLLRGALRHLGYRSTRSHARPGSVRTDAPWEVIWEIIREWVRQKAPVKPMAITPGTGGEGIMMRSRERINARPEGKGGVDDEEEEKEEMEGVRREIAAIKDGKGVEDLVRKVEDMRARHQQRKEQEQGQGQKETPGEGQGEGEQDKKEEAEQQPQQQQQQQQQRPPSPSNKPSPPHPSTLNIVFDEELGKKALANQRSKRLRRYQVNPRPNWGPMSRAGGD